MKFKLLEWLLKWSEDSEPVAPEIAQEAIRKAEEEYQKYSERQGGLLTSSYDKIDTTLVQVSGVILGLSISFTTSLFGKYPLGWMSVLVGGWICLAFTIFCVLISHYSARGALTLSLYEARLIRDRDVQLATNPRANTKHLQKQIDAVELKCRIWRELNASCYRLSALLFIVGILLMIQFTIQNSLMERAIWHATNPTIRH